MGTSSSTAIKSVSMNTSSGQVGSIEKSDEEKKRNLFAINACAEISSTEGFHFMIPLGESLSYSIGWDEFDDFLLRLSTKEHSTICLFHVNATEAKCELENVSNETIKVDDTPVERNDTLELIDHCHIQIGPYIFTYRKIESPSTIVSAKFHDLLLCGVCQRLAKFPVVLSCQHIFCQKCMRNLIDTTLSSSPVRRSNNNFTTNLKETYLNVKCPQCQTLTNITSEMNSVKETTLSTVSSFFDELKDDSPNCVSCKDQRWISHPCDYFFCNTCQKILCPLCAIDEHRNHELTKRFDEMFSEFRNFARKAQNLKTEWSNGLQPIVDSKHNCHQAIARLTVLVEELKTIKEKLSKNDQFTNLQKTYSQLVSLEPPQTSPTLEQRREETLHSFEIEIKQFDKSVEKHLEDLEAKSKSSELIELKKKLKIEDVAIQTDDDDDELPEKALSLHDANPLP